jgi:hypothetical protein
MPRLNDDFLHALSFVLLGNKANLKKPGKAVLASLFPEKTAFSHVVRVTMYPHG